MTGAHVWRAYPALSAPLTMMGVERRWCLLLSATLGLAMWNAINSILVGASIFCVLYGVGWWAWREDPHMLTHPSRVGAVQDALRPREVG